MMFEPHGKHEPPPFTGIVLLFLLFPVILTPNYCFTSYAGFTWIVTISRKLSGSTVSSTGIDLILYVCITAMLISVMPWWVCGDLCHEIPSICSRGLWKVSLCIIWCPSRGSNKVRPSLLQVSVYMSSRIRDNTSRQTWEEWGQSSLVAQSHGWTHGTDITRICSVSRKAKTLPQWVLAHKRTIPTDRPQLRAK
jgi:hypothetical protein